MHQQKSPQKANQTLMLTSGTLPIVPVAVYLERHTGHRVTREDKTKQNTKNPHVTTRKTSQDTSSAAKRKISYAGYLEDSARAPGGVYVCVRHGVGMDVHSGVKEQNQENWVLDLILPLMGCIARRRRSHFPPRPYSYKLRRGLVRIKKWAHLYAQSDRTAGSAVERILRLWEKWLVNEEAFLATSDTGVEARVGSTHLPALTKMV